MLKIIYTGIGIAFKDIIMVICLTVGGHARMEMMILEMDGVNPILLPPGFS